ncbi:unnamed protein product [Brassicogethes aeneus]|uniref:Uncharacterized protein n=1 Tax=Brassicogethes aeneus TaxID=1431903 RepID=A0A9P0FDZ4_BRAAE|nr:unnamed protein product [Brassicogethes aeneus]
MTSAIFLIITLSVLQICLSSPFLYNPSAIPSLISSASAASSSNPQISMNIADLREKKTGKLQEEKEGPIEMPEEHLFEENDNEVAPSLLQKKVNKIIAKLRLISTLSNLGRNNEETNFEENDANATKMIMNPKQEISNISRLTLKKDIEAVVPTASVESIEDLEEEKSRKKEDKPEKITINIQTDKIIKRESPRGNISLSPGDIGVFFMELFASFVGLAYGAAAQAGQPSNSSS